MSVHWKERVADKRRRQQEAIPSDWRISAPGPDVLNVTAVPDTCGLLSERELEITNTTDVPVLLEKLASGTWSSVDVTTAFYKRAIVAQQLTNCLTEIFVERALARAAEVDEHLKKTGKVIGPLHGLPISLKDQLAMKGLETTMGYVSWIGVYSEHDAALVEILYEAGAVPFVRTNIPQTLMWGETFNNVFGRTTNPYNRSLTAGGSSGGEGALVALRGSPLGVGSDIGGSIRIPSAFCGLYGLRPSYHRVPYGGALNSMEGSEGISSVFGPMTNTLGGITTFMRAVISGRPWTKDPYVIRKAWDEDAYMLSEHGHGKKLCIGIMWHNANVLPHPPVTRGLNIVKEALLAAGHEVIEWEPLKIQEIQDMMRDIWYAGCYEDYTTVIADSGEPLLADMAPEREDVAQEPKPGLSAYELWQVHKTKRALREEYLRAWNATAGRTSTGRPIDAIVAPVAACVAPPHGMNKSAVYTSTWNGVDYPALVLPIAKLDPAVDVKHERTDFMSDEDRESWNWYKPETALHAPICVQLVAQTLEEEALLGMGEIVDAAVKAHLTR